MRSFRKAYSLLEVVIASFLLALAIIPAMNFMRTSLRTSYELERWNQLNIVAIAQLEEQVALAADDFTDADGYGTASEPGFMGIRYYYQSSTSTGSGGFSDRLMAVTVLAWDDENGNGGIDAEEPQALMGTKVAKMAVYQND